MMSIDLFIKLILSPYISLNFDITIDQKHNNVLDNPTGAFQSVEGNRRALNLSQPLKEAKGPGSG